DPERPDRQFHPGFPFAKNERSLGGHHDRQRGPRPAPPQGRSHMARVVFVPVRPKNASIPSTRSGNARSRWWSIRERSSASASGASASRSRKSLVRSFLRQLERSEGVMFGGLYLARKMPVFYQKEEVNLDASAAPSGLSCRRPRRGPARPRGDAR